MTSLSLRDRLVEVAGDRYSIDGELGRGGMAVVYAATDVRLKRAVAIKALPPELAFRADVRSRFLREAQMAAGLSHVHIVPIYSVDERDGLVYMVMGRVRGESLAQRLHRMGRLEFSDVRRILEQTADALAHAHAHGVIHRDIKPDNILLDSVTGNVQVTDFGIARAMEGDARLTATGVAVGTPAYMSPEQARGDDDVDGRADVYALGVVGFQMLAGEPPFTAPNTPALLLKHVSEPPPRVVTRRPDAPPSLAYAIDRALMKERDERWATATAFREALALDARPPEHQAVRAASASASRVGLVPARPAAVPLVESRPASVPLPPYPTWRGGGDDEKKRWHEAKRQWREQVRMQQREIGEYARARHDAAQARREAAKQWRGAGKKNLSLSERMRAFQAASIGMLGTMVLLFMINAFAGGPPWFLIPVAAMSLGIAGFGLSVWQQGAGLRDFFRRPSRLAALEDVTVSQSSDPAADVEARARALVGSEVLTGPHGGVVRRAAEDERSVQEILRGLSAADRAQLPDVESTLRSLVERVASVAQALHSLDRDVRPGHIAQLDARLAEARALPDSATDKERRVTLLERQRTSLGELSERRTALAQQMENASLVLQTMRLDLLRLRSAGIGNAAADVRSVTQEARALSTDIGRVLDAASEVRKL